MSDSRAPRSWRGLRLPYAADQRSLDIVLCTRLSMAMDKIFWVLVAVVVVCGAFGLPAEMGKRARAERQRTAESNSARAAATSAKDAR